MRILLTVQGEGRGHLTQAIAVWEMLSQSGHELAGVVAGSNPARQLPQFFLQAFPVHVVSIPSPGFVFSAARGVNLPATLWQALRNLGGWRESLRRLREVVDQTRPDLVVNFFEPLTGLLQCLRPLPVPVIAVAHQFHLLRSSLRLPTRRMEQWWLRRFIRLVGCRSWKVALSFTPEPDQPDQRWYTSPPLLRRRARLLEPEPGDHILVYILNHGYADRVHEWHRDHPDVPLHCFYDRPGAPPEEAFGTLTFHTIDPGRFLRLMASARAVVTTAGFESVCEAAWLGKPVVVIPVEGHLEQMLNAADGQRAGLGLAQPVFDLEVLDRLPEPPRTPWFRDWCLEAESRLQHVIRAATAGADDHQGSVTARASAPTGRSQ